jgi:hypothetical protein
MLILILLKEPCHQPFIKPIAKPADILLVRGLPMFVITSDSTLQLLEVLVVVFAIVEIVPSIYPG